MATYVFMVVMVLLSFTNLFGLNIAGISVYLGVAFFFINKALERQPMVGSGLDFTAIGKNLRDRSIWFWLALPLIMDAVSAGLAKLVLPGYIEHVQARASVLVSFTDLPLAAAQMAVLVLGEEIAWRAFFQNQLAKRIPFAPALIVSSLLFGIGHITGGLSTVVVYDVFFVALNGALYGIIFRKTNNAWVSTLAHFVANLVSVAVWPYL